MIVDIIVIHVGKTMPFALSPVITINICGMYKPFPVMGGKNGLVLPTMTCFWKPAGKHKNHWSRFRDHLLEFLLKPTTVMGLS